MFYFYRANPIYAAEILSLHLDKKIKQSQLINCWSDGCLIFWLVDGEGEVMLGVGQFFESLNNLLNQEEKS